MRSLIAFVLSLAIVSPASAGTLSCLVGEPNAMLSVLMQASGQIPVLKLELGDDSLPAILLGKPDGAFSIVVLLHGRTCVFALGHGMAPAAKDWLFPVELPGKPS